MSTVTLATSSTLDTKPEPQPLVSAFVTQAPPESSTSIFRSHVKLLLLLLRLLLSRLLPIRCRICHILLSNLLFLYSPLSPCIFDEFFITPNPSDDNELTIPPAPSVQPLPAPTVSTSSVSDQGIQLLLS